MSLKAKIKGTKKSLSTSFIGCVAKGTMIALCVSLVLVLIFEILKEVGIRMQQSVGHAMSIVGGLVVGQAAVEANIVSAPLLIITAFSGITGP